MDAFPPSPPSSCLFSFSLISSSHFSLCFCSITTSSLHLSFFCFIFFPLFFFAFLLFYLLVFFSLFLLVFLFLFLVRFRFLFFLFLFFFPVILFFSRLLFFSRHLFSPLSFCLFFLLASLPQLRLFFIRFILISGFASIPTLSIDTMENCNIILLGTIILIRIVVSVFFCLNWIHCLQTSLVLIDTERIFWLPFAFDSFAFV
mmetsp:Transcript_27820/g.51445  ORF Transcript_27820/g.51445 Transcript_27820/m.51445 type:complete len:202 (-) Transcript_27820:632-1237(-)